MKPLQKQTVFFYQGTEQKPRIFLYVFLEMLEQREIGCLSTTLVSASGRLFYPSETDC